MSDLIDALRSLSACPEAEKFIMLLSLPIYNLKLIEDERYGSNVLHNTSVMMLREMRDEYWKMYEERNHA